LGHDFKSTEHHVSRQIALEFPLDVTFSEVLSAFTPAGGHTDRTSERTVIKGKSQAVISCEITRSLG
jgi:hypothetical protein